ncbi:MAG: arginase family protein [Pelolinea sp.]|nr:arginase family protein [Pelolinea sp.]
MENAITFAGFPSCLDLDKLKADIAVIGIPYGTPYDVSKPTHSLNAPAAIRQESVRYPDDPIAWDFDLGDTLLGRTGACVADCGDLPGSQADPQGNRRTAVSAIQKILKAGAIPVVLGGDDSIPIPVLRAYEEQEPFYVLQLDAHIDWRSHVDGVSEGYSSTMRRASEMPWVKGITQVGMRGVGSAREEEYRAALDYGANLVTSCEIRREGIDAALVHLPDRCRCFITMDFDVLDPSVIPAVGAPMPGGLSYADVVELFQAVALKTQVVGVCLVELVPELDVNHLGTITAMRVAWNAIGALARNLDN